MLSEGGNLYMATAVTYSIKGPFDVQKALDGSRDQSLANVHGTVTSEKPIKLDGYAGREISFSATGTQQEYQRNPIHGVMRVFAGAHPPAAFMAMVAWKAEKPEADVQKFLTSVHLGKSVETKPKH